MFAVVHVPQFSLQAALRHEPELWNRPVALVDPAARPAVVIEMTQPAAAAGVTPGLTPTQAMARCGNILIRSRSMTQETAAGTALLQHAYAFSPHLEATAPGVCTLDLRGLAALSGANRDALEKWARQLQRACASLQLSVAIGLGPTPDVARHAARWGKGIEVVDDPQPFINALPLEALNPSSDAAAIINRWGIQTVGELLALGQESLTARLGLEALALFAAASSSAVRPLRLTQPAEQFEESFEFNPEVETLEPLLFLLRRFVDQLSQRLTPRGLVAETLLLELGLESGEKLAYRLQLPKPTRQADVLFRALHTHLETVRTESAVQLARLTIVPTASEQKQLGLFETVLSDPHQFQETLARLAAILGPDRVGTPALENSHRPDAFKLVPPDFENAPVPVENSRPVPTRVTPMRRFRPPVPAEVECSHEPLSHPLSQTLSTRSSQRPPSPVASPRPLSIRCAVVNGKLQVLVGPWRASGHWWETGGWEREEWDAATSDGHVIRLVHQPDGWFVEGMMD